MCYATIVEIISVDYTIMLERYWQENQAELEWNELTITGISYDKWFEGREETNSHVWNLGAAYFFICKLWKDEKRTTT
jgi:hypothetical protein